MKWITHPVLVALGVVTLCSSLLTGPLVSPDHDAVYHLCGFAHALFLPVAVDLCFFWLVVATVLWVAGRVAWIFVGVWCVLFVSLPWILVKNWASLTNLNLWPAARELAIGPPIFAIVAVALFRSSDAGAIFARAQNFLATVLGFSSLLGVLLVGELVWFGWRARNLNAPLPLHTVSATHAARTGHARVIWILLDELSYRQVYGDRYPGLELPAFDRLAAGATVFTHVAPAGEDTELVVPSLLTGFPVDRLGVNASGVLTALHDPDADTWRAFDPHRTVFRDALELGYGTAVAGWYNPYCRILPDVLDRCFWMDRSPFHGHMYGDKPVAANIGGPFRGLAATAWDSFVSHRERSALDVERMTTHIEDYKDIRAAGDSLLEDATCSFILLHLPIPHPGGIFDFHRREFGTPSASYVGNLALADDYLAHVRKLLEERGDWDGATVMVMGDHSWRTTTIWAGAQDWTAEDEAASHGGRFDDRPAYIVKLPGQQDAARIDLPFRAVRTRALLDALLADRLHTSGDLRAWVVHMP